MAEDPIKPDSIADGSAGLKQFQLSTDRKAKQKEAWGKSLGLYIEGMINGNTGYYFLRNSQVRTNRQWAAGTINVQAMFQDLLKMNAKTNYINLQWLAISLVNTIVSKLVGRWMTLNERIEVTATDSLSEKNKKDQFDAAEFLLHHREMMEQLQQQSGVQMVSPDQFVPEDQNDLDLWRSHFLRLPEEILAEEGINDVLEANGWFDVLKEMALWDAAVTGFVGTETWMDEYGVIHVEQVELENAIYSYSRYNDFRDTFMRGRVKDMKISEIRRKYGVEFGGKLTEEQIFQIAATCKEYQLIDKISWINEYSYSFIRPYDEWNTSVIVYEIKSCDSEGYTITTTKQNQSTIMKKGWPVDKKGNPVEKLDDNQRYVEDKTWNIYRGVYVRNTQIVLEWGIKQNMIRPQDPTSQGDCEFSFSFYMPQSRDMRNLAVPQKVQEPATQMILTRLKIQQLVMKMRPPGAVINEAAMQAIDYGLGDKNKDVDAKKHFDQTGDLYYRGVDDMGRPIPVPITELANAGFQPQMEALMALYVHHFNVLKDELGEDPNLISAATKPRVAAANVQAAQGENMTTTGYFYGAYLYCMAETAKKVSCLQKDSIEHGAEAYRHLFKGEDIANRVFQTKAKMLPTEAEIDKLDAMMNQAIASNPDLIMYLDTFKVLRMAKENVKLGELYFRNAMKKMLRTKQQMDQQNAQNNAASLQQAAQLKNEGELQSKQLDIQKQQVTNDGQLKNTALTGIMSLFVESMKSGAVIPAEVQPLTSAILQNVMAPALIQNEQVRGAVIQQMQAARQQNQEAQGEPPAPDDQGQQQPDQDQQQQQAPQDDQQQSQQAA